MLVCTVDGDLYPPLEEPTGTTDPKSKKKDKDKDKKFVWNHGSESRGARLVWKRGSGTLPNLLHEVSRGVASETPFHALLLALCG